MLALLGYYVFAPLVEPALVDALRHSGLAWIWRGSRLLTVEFAVLYYPVLTYVIGFLIPRAGEDLRAVCWKSPACRAYLRPPGWFSFDISERSPPFIDLADIQWRGFREALAIILPLAALLSVCLRVLTRHFASRKHLGKQLRMIIGLGVLLYIHGAGAAFLITLALLFYASGTLLAASSFGTAFAWGLAIFAIAAKEPNFPIRRHLTFQTFLGDRWGFLDGHSYQGEYDWAQSVNLVVLRLLSFSLDCNRASRKSPDNVSKASFVALTGSHYSLTGCVSHAFYAPLFLAGPTICFDDFVDQCHAPRASTSPLGLYLLQLVGGIAALEIGTHMYPCFALARSGELSRLGPRLGAAAVFLTLNLMWLKFFVLWRVARMWALADGIDPPENMRRALCNHYSVASFWQCWHASFNRWLVRYIYVPAGGRNNRVLATALTFLFVALWHDAEAKLLAWGGLNAFFIALEVALSSAMRRHLRDLEKRRPWVHRQLCALGGTSCIFLLMAVNMIGYSVGVGGISGLLSSASAAGAEGLQVLGVSYVFLFCGVQVMFEIRALDGTFGAALAREAQADAQAATGSQPASDVKSE
mmetsp:Transcript_88267/g.248529  ORF Transcript_88267/g.248529 Transcript_88267/m.248529 type:complete len:585 (+) Transcript_88267:70-1824(+)